MKKLVVLLLIGPSVASAAGRVYYNNFESGSSIGRCSIGGNAFDGGKAYSGNGMAICNWDGQRKAANWTDPLADVTFDVPFQYSNEFFVRFKQRADSDYDTPSTGAKWIRFGDSSTTILQLDGDTVHWGLCDATCSNILINKWTPEMANTIYTKKWHEWAIYWRGGSNGRYTVWLNGKVMGDASGDAGNAPKSPIHFGSNWSVNPGWEHDANNHRYIDDVEIYSDAGSGASGSMENGTIAQSGGGQQPPPPPPQSATEPPSSSAPLAAPSNLRVIP